MDPRAGLDDVEKRKFLIIPGIELRPLGRPARSQSLYRLSYPDSLASLFIFVRTLAEGLAVLSLGWGFYILPGEYQEHTLKYNYLLVYLRS
jgi:hypothetical protein